MAISIDWGTKVITVPQADLTPLGGDSYELDTYQFHIDLRDLEDNEAGQVFPPTHNHNTTVNLGGVVYARVIEIINGYTVTFQDVGSPYRVTLVGSNNNILDVTNLNDVSVASNNSAGLQVVTSGSGVTEQDKADIANLVWTEVIEGSLTAEQLMRLMSSALAAKVAGMDVQNPVFRDVNDTKNRITSTTDEHGNRTVVTVDVTP